MKILKNKTYDDLLNANSVLSSKNANLKSNLDILSDKVVRLERKLIKVEKDSEILTEGIVRIEQEKSEIRKKMVELEKDRLYVNLTRDKKGILHSINPSSRARKRTAPAPALTADQIVEKYLGRKIDTKERGVGRICGTSANKRCVLVGFENNDGWIPSDEGSIIIKEYKSYWNVPLKVVISQLS